MDISSQYKIIFFLSSVLVITTIIGEFSRIETIKEGMGFGGLFTMVIKLIICSGHFFMMIFRIIFWLIQCAIMWIPIVIGWLLQYIICAFQKLINIPNCFLWYVLEIIGKVIYLPFRLTFYVLDLLLASVDAGFSIQDVVNHIWWFIDDIDHMIYDSGAGFHIVHYPNDVIKRCYSCKVGKFPKPPPFPMKSVTSFTKCIR
jgi:hypothetical protein